MTNLTASTVNADIILNTLFKYGVTGYKSEGVSNTTTITTHQNKNKYTTVTTTDNSLRTEKKYGITPGIGLQAVPSESGMCLGAGYYFDETMEMSLGWKF